MQLMYCRGRSFSFGFRGLWIVYPTSVKDGAQNIFVPKHRVVQYGNCNASYTPGPPLVYGNRAPAPQGTCAPWWRRGDPPSHCGGGIPNPRRSDCRPGQLKSNRGRIRERVHAYAWPWPWTGLRAPEKAAQPRQQHAPRGGLGPPPEMKPDSGAGPGLVPDTGSGTGLNKTIHP